MANYQNAYGPPPPGFDPGHAIMPNQIQRNAASVYGLLNTVGEILSDVDRSRQATIKRGLPEIVSGMGIHNQIGNVALQIQDRMTHQNEYDSHLFDDMGQYTFDEAGNMYLNGKRVKNAVVSNSSPQQIQPPVYQGESYDYDNNYEEEIETSYNNMADLNQYLSGGNRPAKATRPVTAPPTATTTITFNDLQSANKPIVDKLEVICQLLGKIWGVEMDTQRILAALPEETAIQISNIQLGQMEPDESILDEVQAEVDAEDEVLSPEAYLPQSTQPVVSTRSNAETEAAAGATDEAAQATKPKRRVVRSKK